MDLVESMAKNGDSAVVSKQRVAERAVRATREDGNPASGLECLRLIEDRLRRASFSRVQNTVGPALLDAVAARTLAFPELTLQSSVTAPVELELNKSWFGRGVLQGLRNNRATRTKQTNWYCGMPQRWLRRYWQRNRS